MCAIFFQARERLFVRKGVIVGVARIQEVLKGGETIETLAAEPVKHLFSGSNTLFEVWFMSFTARFFAFSDSIYSVPMHCAFSVTVHGFRHLPFRTGASQAFPSRRAGRLGQDGDSGGGFHRCHALPSRA